MENKIYVVMGTTGEYSDRSEWLVIAYFDEEKAKQHVTLARQEAKRILHLAKHYNKFTREFERIYDAAGYIDSSIDYFYYDIKLVTE